MDEELKPVNCGCGGKAHVLQPSYTNCYVVACPKCGIKTAFMNTKAEAIESWNRAIGERTAKVEHQINSWEDDRHYIEGMCASCGRNVYDHTKYCDECGARLEWK